MGKIRYCRIKKKTIEICGLLVWIPNTYPKPNTLVLGHRIYGFTLVLVKICLKIALVLVKFYPIFTLVLCLYY
jgi:hypothetical protein